jgi:hypothetical protein
MAFDSSSELLFSIGADTSDAEGNIQRFRSLLGKDLDDISAEFSDWSSKIFGDLSTVQGAAVAGASVLGAAVLGVGTAMVGMAEHYATYVSEVERGSKATGISTEQMSGLKFMAEETGTSYDSLVTGLTRFASTVVKAAGGSEQQMKAFERLGISQAQVKAGEKDMMPLLELVADRFMHLGSQVDKTAMARDLFSRGGQALVRMLSLGSAGIKQFEEECKKLGMTVHTQDVVAMEEFKATSKATEAQMEALGNEIGKITLPVLELFKKGVLGLAIELRDLPHLLKGDYWATVRKDFNESAEGAQRLAHALANMPADGGEPLKETGEKAVKVREDFSALSDVLARVQAQMTGSSLDERVAEQIEHIGAEWAKAKKAYEELHAANHLSVEDEKTETAALAQFSATMGAFLTYTNKQIAEKNEKIAEDLRRLIGEQQEKTLAQEIANWNAEQAKRLVAMQKEQGDNATNLQLLDELTKAGYARVERTKTEAIEKTGQELDQRLAAQRQRTYAEDVAAWDREMAALTLESLKKTENAAVTWAQLALLDQAGREKLKANQEQSFAEEIVRLQEHLKQTISAETTAKEKLWLTYQEDLARYSDVEKKKALATATSAEQRAQIEKEFAALRSALLKKYGIDLQALQNSQGWQGVFGSHFSALIRSNEALMNEWAASTNRDTLMVKVALQGLQDMAKKAFEQFAQGMGANIAHAVIYSKSIKQAMEAALESTIESISAQALAQAIYSLGLGFLDLAEGDLAGAAAAFEAAAIFGAVGGAMALAGRAMAPSQSSAAAEARAGGSGSGSGSQGASTGDTVPGPGGASGSHVTVNVYGHVVGTSGVSELCGMLNDAVLNQDSTLTATNTKTGVQVVR